MNLIKLKLGAWLHIILGITERTDGPKSDKT